MGRLKIALIVAVLGLLAFSPLVALTSAAPSTSSQKAIIPPPIPPRVWVLRLTADGWANPFYPPGVPQKATLEAWGILYTCPRLILPAETNQHETGRIIIKRLTVSIGGKGTTFNNGYGHLSGRYIFIHATNRAVWLAESEEATARSIRTHIWLFGQRTGDEVKLKGLLFIESPKGFTLWRLSLTGELKLIPIHVIAGTDH